MPPFGVNEMRLNLRQWLAALAIMLGCAWGIPRLWPRIERFDTGPDYRIPSALHKDYWLYQRRLEQIADPACVPVLGDSVIWGEYVRPTGTLTHFLNQETGRLAGFINCGMDGLFPLALEGLLDYYGSALRNRKLIIHCNVLWMSSAKADLSVKKEEDFNHSRLVPQFCPRLPCFRADVSERLTALVERNVGFFAWVNHLDDVYFDQRSIPRWTLEENTGDPPRRGNAWRNPLTQITLAVPGDPPDDPQRGPGSVRHKPWSEGGVATTYFDWVALDASLQWQAFQRMIRLLQDRGNEVFVLVGPFNEHLVAEEQRGSYRRLRDGIAAWLAANRIAHFTAETLPSRLYADASHPLTDGYALWAKHICQDGAFRHWLVQGTGP
jgi:hypothetical protein